MAKFSRFRVRPNVRSAIKTVGMPTVRTHEGARAFTHDPKSELFLLAVTNMVAERTFYEGADESDKRFVDLIHRVTKVDPEWMQRFVPWLRNEANMRSAAVVAAAEYVKAGGPHGRKVIASAVARADEPAEILGYWSQEHGRAFPQPVKRGVADAVRRQYTEYTALKYDGLSRAWRMGDVIELTHPKPVDAEQSDLFRYLLDRRHHPESLSKVGLRVELDKAPVEQRRELLRERGADLLREAGATWEWLSGWVQGGMDAEAWETVIPSMGYMALLRNLRNFDEAGISDERVRYVQEILADPERVARSRQFPYRFWSAYRNVPSLRWAATLETALEHSVTNIPVLPGRTLVLTDTSASMVSPVSRGSKVRHFEIAALFAAAVAKQARSSSTFDVPLRGSRPVGSVDLVSFASGWEPMRFRRTQSILRTIEKVESRIGVVGHGTMLGHALKATFRGHDRVVVFSDMQTHDQVPAMPGAKVYVFSTGGYRATPFAVGRKGHYELGGFSDSTFRLMALLEDLRDTNWPF